MAIFCFAGTTAAAPAVAAQAATSAAAAAAVAAVRFWSAALRTFHRLVLQIIF